MYVVRKDGIEIDLGHFTCPRNMSSRCNVLGCPVHTPQSNWGVTRRIEAFVNLEQTQKVVVE